MTTARIPVPMDIGEKLNIGERVTLYLQPGASKELEVFQGEVIGLDKDGYAGIIVTIQKVLR